MSFKPLYLSSRGLQCDAVPGGAAPQGTMPCGLTPCNVTQCMTPGGLMSRHAAILCVARCGRPTRHRYGNLRTIIMDVRGGIPRPMGNFPESLCQQILVGIILVGRLGVRRCTVPWPCRVCAMRQQHLARLAHSCLIIRHRLNGYLA